LVKADEPLVELETDKVSVEVPSPAAGVLEHISVQQGGTVNVGTVLGQVKEGEAPKPAAKPEKAKAEAKPAKAELPKPETKAAPAKEVPLPPPSVRRIAEEERLDVSTVAGTGKRGQVTKADALAALEAAKVMTPARPAAEAPAGPRPRAEREERVTMSRLRKTIALRLKESQEIAAQLTTFNEVDMSAVIELRKRYQERYEKKHGVKLGFMSFFVKAAVNALEQFPAVNASLEGDEVVFHHYYDIGVAVSGSRGLVVPVIRGADELSMAELEKAIADFGVRARNDKLTLSELQGGTFTLSNGGIFGSMLSTPILNPPQTGILGMHNIVERPVARDGQVVIRPVMYLALSYDHRLIDGREAVQFLVRIKDCIEDPERILLDV